LRSQWRTEKGALTKNAAADILPAELPILGWAVNAMADKKKSVSLAVGRGEKLSAAKGAGLTAKGREKYNRETGSNLKAPAPNPKTKADAGRKASFCARMGAVAAKAKDGERAKASLKRWKCS
jgi:hypothetical protein